MLVKPGLTQLFPKKIAMELANGQIYPSPTDEINAVPEPKNGY
jgi:hypothetical protein